jgi:lipoprotein-releasing system ATP-binding protein
VAGIKRHFVTPDGRLEILRGIDWTAEAGQMTAIIGASGVGKSTFLHILGGLDAPSAGQVYWEETSPYEMSEEDRARYRNRTVGFVFQFHHLLPEFTAEENVALPLIIGGAPRNAALDRAGEVLDDVGLRERRRHRPGELSGGEQQRAAVARALVTGARLIIADEPSGNLDHSTAEQLHEMLGNIYRERGCSVVVATHNQDLANRADRVFRLRDGVLNRIDGQMAAGDLA